MNISKIAINFTLSIVVAGSFTGCVELLKNFGVEKYPELKKAGLNDGRLREQVAYWFEDSVKDPIQRDKVASIIYSCKRKTPNINSKGSLKVMQELVIPGFYSITSVAKFVHNENDAHKVCSYRDKDISNDNIIQILKGKKSETNVLSNKNAEEAAQQAALKASGCDNLESYNKIAGNATAFSLKGVCIDVKNNMTNNPYMPNTDYQFIQLMNKKSALYKISNSDCMAQPSFFYIIFQKKNGYIQKNLNIKYAKFTGNVMPLRDGTQVPVAIEVK